MPVHKASLMTQWLIIATKTTDLEGCLLWSYPPPALFHSSLLFWKPQCQPMPAWDLVTITGIASPICAGWWCSPPTHLLHGHEGLLLVHSEYTQSMYVAKKYVEAIAIVHVLYRNIIVWGLIKSVCNNHFRNCPFLKGCPLLGGSS